MAAILLSSIVVAQMAMPKAGPEHKRLDYFVGNWTLAGDMKPSPMGPGGKMSETEKTEWMEGGFFILSHVNFTGAMGNGTGVSVMGYNNEEKTYTYDAFNSWGEAEHAKGTVEGDTWTWTSENKMMGKSVKERFTIKITSPTTHDFKFEMQGDDGKWTTVMDGKATKNS